MAQPQAQAQAGGEHSLTLDSKGDLHSAGACGLGWNRALDLTKSLYAWRKVTLPEPAANIHASYYHNLAVMASGSLYSWGCGTFVDEDLHNDGVIPALGGQRADLGGLPEAVNLPAGERAIGLSGGAYHSIILTSQKRVLTFGATQLGQLGRTMGPNSATDGAGLPVDANPLPVEGLPEGEEVQSIGAGFYNTFAALKNGKLFCAGENQNKQCGTGASNLRRMTEVMVLKGEHVAAVSGGYCHTLVLTRDSKVLTMGCANEGQRGDGEINNDARAVVTPAEVPCKAVAVAAGANHSIILGDDGHAYSFGSNEYGQCAAAEGVDHVVSPSAVVLPLGAGRVVSVSAGYAHSVLTTDQGKVFAFGQNESGQLGLGEDGVKVDAVAVVVAVRSLNT